MGQTGREKELMQSEGEVVEQAIVKPESRVITTLPVFKMHERSTGHKLTLVSQNTKAIQEQSTKLT